MSAPDLEGTPPSTTSSLHPLSSRHHNPSHQLKAEEEANKENEGNASDPASLLASLEAELEATDTATYHPPSSHRESLAQHHAEERKHAKVYTQPRTNHPPLETLSSDDTLLHFTTHHHTCIVHFSHPDFTRCEIMDGHITRVAGRHGHEVRFGKVDVRQAPFVVERLGVRVLPCVVGFVDGVAVGRLVGFDGLAGSKGGVGGGEEGVRVTKGVEKVMVGWGVLLGVTRGWEVGPGINGIGGGDGSSSGSGEEEEEDDDEDEGKRRKNRGGLFGGGGGGGKQRGIYGGKKVLAKGEEDDDDDGWD